MSYHYSILRFVPDPARGEFINIGAVAGDAADWELRLVKDLRRAKAIDEEDALELALDFADRLDTEVDEIGTSGGSKANQAVPMVDRLRSLSGEMQNVVQLTDPAPVVAGSALEALDLVFSELVFDEAETPPRLRASVHATDSRTTSTRKTSARKAASTRKRKTTAKKATSARRKSTAARKRAAASKTTGTRRKKSTTARRKSTGTRRKKSTTARRKSTGTRRKKSTTARRKTTGTRRKKSTTARRKTTGTRRKKSTTVRAAGRKGGRTTARRKATGTTRRRTTRRR